MGACKIQKDCGLFVMRIFPRSVEQEGPRTSHAKFRACSRA